MTKTMITMYDKYIILIAFMAMSSLSAQFTPYPMPDSLSVPTIPPPWNYDLIQEPSKEYILGFEFPKGTTSNWLWNGSNLYLSGLWDGVHDIIHHKYHKFRSVFPNADPQYWNPDVSWTNKWQNGDPAQGEAFLFSSTALVWTTDASHLTKSLRSWHAMATISIPIGYKKKKWYYYLIDTLVYSLARSAGFHTSYSLLFNGMNP